MTSSINKIFVFVDNDEGKATRYKDAYANPQNPINENSEYYNKIAFLEETGEIVTHGKVFAFNNSDSFNLLSQKVSFLLQMIGDINESGTIDGNEIGLAQRISSLENLVGVSGDENNIIDKLSEIITWFNGLNEDSPSTVTKLINDIETNTNTIGKKSINNEPATGLFKYIDDKIEEVKIEDSTQSSGELGQNKHVKVSITEKGGKLSSVSVDEQDIASATNLQILSNLVGNNEDDETLDTLAARIKRIENNPQVSVHGTLEETLLDFQELNDKKEIIVKSSYTLNEAVKKANSAVQHINSNLIEVTYLGDSYTLTPKIGSLYVQNGEFTYNNGDDTKMITVGNVVSAFNNLDLWQNFN